MSFEPDPKLITSQEYALILERLEAMSYPQLGAEFKDQKSAITAMDATLKKAKAEFDVLRLKVIPDKMDEDEMSSVNIRGIGRLGLTLDAHVSVLASDREEWFQWLRENNAGDLIKEGVNSSTQKAFIKEQIREGHELPAIVKHEAFYRAAVTKV